MTLPSRPPLRAALASPDSKSRYVRRLFSTIADRYDLITVLLSYGQDRRWKRRLAELTGAGPAHARSRSRVRHRRHRLCGGRPRRTRRRARRHAPHGAARAAEGAGVQAVRFVTGDMMALPFRDEEFDVVTTGYGIRNVPEISGAIAEMRRVLKPGGTLLSLDFNRPLNPLVRGVYLDLPHSRRLGAWSGSSPGPRHLSLHSGVDPAVSRRRRGQRDDPPPGILGKRAPAGARRADGDPSRDEVAHRRGAA